MQILKIFWKSRYVVAILIIFITMFFVKPNYSNLITCCFGIFFFYALNLQLEIKSLKKQLKKNVTTEVANGK